MINRRRIIPLVAAICTLAAGRGTAAPDPAGAVNAMLALPYKFQNGVLEVRGKNGAPDPAEWLITARDADTVGTITQLTVAGGQVISQRVSGNLGQMFRESGYIDPKSISADSAQVFQSACKFFRETKSVEVASADFVLVKPSADLAPQWQVLCRAADGKALGTLVLSATNGAVLTQQ